jgi:ferredoxin-NADP reductase
MRVRDSAFKRTVATMPVGAELLVEGPFDDLRLHRGLERGRELVLLAGGVGVAPFLSVLREAAAAGRALPAKLFYSNRRPEDAAYLEEPQQLEHEIPGFHLVATMTRMTESARSWCGAVERLSAGFLGRCLPSVVGPAYYLAGAPFFISQMRAELLGAGVSDLDIGIEMYGGY